MHHLLDEDYKRYQIWLARQDCDLRLKKTVSDLIESLYRDVSNFKLPVIMYREEDSLMVLDWTNRNPTYKIVSVEITAGGNAEWFYYDPNTNEKEGMIVVAADAMIVPTSMRLNLQDLYSK